MSQIGINSFVQKICYKAQQKLFLRAYSKPFFPHMSPAGTLEVPGPLCSLALGPFQCYSLCPENFTLLFTSLTIPFLFKKLFF